MVAGAGGLRISGALGWLTQQGRRFAIDGGWYAGRGPWQIGGLVAAGLAVLTLAGLIARQRGAHRRQRAAFGLALGLTGVLAVRAISWHATGVLLARDVAGISIGAWMEAATLGLLATSGLLAWRAGRGE